MSTVSGIQGLPIEVTVVGCVKLKDMEWMSRQDPYVCVEYASTKFKTRTCTDGGINPTFQEKFAFNLIEGLREINIVVWNSNTIRSDDFIGSGRVQLNKVLSQGFDDSYCTVMDRCGKFSGEVRLILHYSYANCGKVNDTSPYGMGAPTATYAAPYVVPSNYPAAVYPQPPSTNIYPPTNPEAYANPHPPSILYPPFTYPPSVVASPPPPPGYPTNYPPPSAGYPYLPPPNTFCYPSGPPCGIYPPPPY